MHWVKCGALAQQVSVLPHECAFPAGRFLYSSETPVPIFPLSPEGHFSTWNSQAVLSSGDEVRGMECHSSALKIHPMYTWKERAGQEEPLLFILIH